MPYVKEAYPISEETWTKVPESGTYRYKGDKTNRTFEKFIIGTETQPSGSKIYIQEEIYSDLYKKIVNKDYTVHVDLYSEPSVVIEKDGKLICHNQKVQIFKEQIEEALETQAVVVSQEIAAMVELRNNRYSGSALGKNTKRLREFLNDELESKVNYDFLRLIIREIYCKVSKEDKLAFEFFTYPKEELISVYGGLIEYEKTGASRIEPLKSLIENGIDVTEIRKAVLNEIARRFFEGGIS